jgi:Spy/CpxP family protein refolding chaperone
MKNKLAKIVAILTVVGLMFAGPVAYATLEGNNPESGKGPQREAAQGSIMERLNLTPEQTTEFIAMGTADLEKGKAITEPLNTKIQALHTAIAKPGATQADVKKLITEIGTLQEKLLSLRVDRLFTLKKILTPEQFAKMQEMDKQEMGKRRA